MSELKSALVTMLQNRQQIGMDGDLALYPTADGFFLVDYILNEQTVHNLNLTSAQKKLCLEDEELMEMFDEPEAAVDFYLQLTKNRIQPNLYNGGKKRTIKEKVAASDKDKYF